MKSFNYLSITTIVFAIVLVVSFFLPWFNLKFLGIIDIAQVEGYEIPNIGSMLGSELYWLKLVYAFPVLALGIITLTLAKVHFWKSTVELILFLLFLFWICKLVLLFDGLEVHLFKAIGVGLFLTSVSVLVFFVDMYNLGEYRP